MRIDIALGIGHPVRISSLDGRTGNALSGADQLLDGGLRASLSIDESSNDAVGARQFLLRLSNLDGLQQTVAEAEGNVARSLNLELEVGVGRAQPDRVLLTGSRRDEAVGSESCSVECLDAGLLRGATLGGTIGIEGDDVADLTVGDGHILVVAVEGNQVLVRALSIADIEGLVAELEQQVLGHGQSRAVGEHNLLVVAGGHIVTVGGGVVLGDVHKLRDILSVAAGGIGRTLGNNLSSRLSINNERPSHLALAATGLEVESVAALGSFLLTANLHRGDVQRVLGRGLQLKLNQVEGDTLGKRTLDAVEGQVVGAEVTLKHEGGRGGVLDAGDIGERHRNLTGCRADLLSVSKAELDVAQLYLGHCAQAEKECHKGKSRNFSHKIKALIGLIIMVLMRKDGCTPLSAYNHLRYFRLYLYGR